MAVRAGRCNGLSAKWTCYQKLHCLYSLPQPPALLLIPKVTHLATGMNSSNQGVRPFLTHITLT
ncbi:hypothetical protein PROFUN_13367, partial [Planoprotostelium fungivorum]